MQEVNYRKQLTGKKARFMVLLLILIWVAIASLIKDYRHIKKGFERRVVAEKRLQAEKDKKAQLTEELARVESGVYKERQIRNELNMQKNGEVVVVLLDKTESLEDSLEMELESEESSKNWQKWLSLVW